jgi:hypothetical protein
VDFFESKEAFQSFPDSILTGDNFSRGQDEAGIRLIERDGGLQVSAIQRLLYQDVALFRLVCWHVYLLSTDLNSTSGRARYRVSLVTVLYQMLLAEEE